jgi:heme A synthase
MSYPTTIHPWTSNLAKVCVVLTFALILLGAIVTTSGAGMAAPNAPHVDGTLLNPTVPGTNIPWWRDPALLKEHSHRLVAMALGLAVAALAAMLWRNWIALVLALALMGGAEIGRSLGWSPAVIAQVRIWPAMIVFVLLLIWRARRRGEKPSAEQWLALAAFCCACLQALLGALRVEFETAGKLDLATDIRTFHGVFAQAFLALLVVLAGRVSPVFREVASRPDAAKYRRVAFSLLILYFMQLACASYLRHRNLGLLIPTWPEAQATGGWWIAAWPHVDGATRHKLMIHFLHTRILPVLILGHALGMALGLARRAAGELRLTRLGWGVLALVGIQIVLGVLVIWRGRHPHITNTHVMVGALICATTALLYARAQRCRAT